MEAADHHDAIVLPGFALVSGTGVEAEWGTYRLTALATKCTFQVIVNLYI